MAAVDERDVTLRHGFLLCPLCGYGFLHHADLRVFQRPQEDAERGRLSAVNVDGSLTSLADVSMALCPSARRDGLTLTFWCEMCTGDDERTIPYELCIAQRKGETRVFWRARSQNHAAIPRR